MLLIMLMDTPALVTFVLHLDTSDPSSIRMLHALSVVIATQHSYKALPTLMAPKVICYPCTVHASLWEYIYEEVGK
jgi:hypothetical protein